MKEHHKLSESAYSQVVIVTMVGAILGGLVFGLASDRRGRKAMMITAFLGALVVVPLWALSEDMTFAVIGGFMMQFMVQGAWGIIPAHINELSPDQVRGVLPGFAYQCGNLLSSWIGWAQSELANQSSFPKVLGISASVIFLIAIAVIAAGPERHAAAFGED
jgi:SHS family lactate transporter-like MFS transporter